MEHLRVDVIIIGAGQAGLSLARQLLLRGGKQILLIDKRASIPPNRQKVGESSVQVAGYYLSRVLDLEEHLLYDHFMKYNLRFYWKRFDTDGAGMEDYNSSHISNFSNIASYQLDRNRLEEHLLALNSADERFQFLGGCGSLQVDLKAGETPHEVSFRRGDRAYRVTASWVVDTSGRGRFLNRQMGTAKTNNIRHGAAFFWVEGTVNIEKLTGQSPREVRLHPHRRHMGHLPLWLATNHFMGEGFWFWVIPLRGKTSLGLVYDSRIIAHEEVAGTDRLLRWICREFPLFGRDLTKRKILGNSSYKDFSHDCVSTISADGWAMAGESGRFTDPLYSPGGDLIALYNTMIVDAVFAEDRDQLRRKAAVYERMMTYLYEAYVPSYSVSYDALGDQEVFGLKYVWELTIYFGFYVFPFINDLFVDHRFLINFLNRFSKLGRLNFQIHSFLSDFFQWKKTNLPPSRGPVFFDFSSLGPLRRAEKTFYRVGVSLSEARRVLGEQLENLEELARFNVAWVCSRVLGNPAVLFHGAFVEGIDLKKIRFDEDQIRRNWQRVAHLEERFAWSFDPDSMISFINEPESGGKTEPVSGRVEATA